jgi:ribulose-5-phosphate 4-epimerase/fuculose-1-phosphate aldolase
MSESRLREQITLFGKSLFDRGLTMGSSGNISARLDDGWLLTPTNSCLGRLDPAAIAKLDKDGNHLSGDPHSVAVSCLPEVDARDVLPPLTAYYVMRVGTLPLVPYYPPGDRTLAEAVRGLAGKHSAMLLANHGPVVAGKTLEAALYATARRRYRLPGHAAGLWRWHPR